jgi:hypothetical protein
VRLKTLRIGGLDVPKATQLRDSISRLSVASVKSNLLNDCSPQIDSGLTTTHQQREENDGENTHAHMPLPNNGRCDLQPILFHGIDFAPTQKVCPEKAATCHRSPNAESRFFLQTNHTRPANCVTHQNPGLWGILSAK